MFFIVPALNSIELLMLGRLMVGELEKVGLSEKIWRKLEKKKKNKKS